MQSFSRRVDFPMFYLPNCLVAIIWICFLTVYSLPAFAETRDRYVLMVSFDGFRADYVELWSLPNFSLVIDNGAGAESLVPAFPSKTFPNHYTLVTGMYPGSHGIVDNSFYAPELGLSYSIGNRSAVTNPDFYSGIPLWQHLENNGFRSASYFWVGSEAPVAGAYPSKWEVYDETVPNTERIATVMEWFSAPEQERPHFVSLYFDLVDSASHEHGPLSEETRNTAIEADMLVGEIIRQLETLPVEVDLILVSDHGMEEVQDDPDFKISLDELGLPQPGIRAVNGQTLVHLYAENDTALFAWFEAHQTDNAHLKVMRREQTPDEWHYRIHPHTGEVLLIADPGYVFVNNAQQKMQGQGEIRGVHGYDPRQNPALQGIFYAAGPHIKQGQHLGRISNIEVAPFVARLLQLPVLPDAESDGGELLGLVND
jgi:predicted AlkP superfamily pyrophosphatase or phosphodiesterase